MRVLGKGGAALSRAMLGLIASSIATVAANGCRASPDLAVQDVCPLADCGESCERLECRSTHQCPRGTSCQGDRCDLTPSSEIASDLLTSNFGVAEFELISVPGSDLSGPAFEWFPPEGSERATCALFVCEPTFVSEDGPAGTILTRISNAARCVDRQRVFRIGEGASTERFSFTLGDLEPHRTHCPPGLALRQTADDGSAGAPGLGGAAGRDTPISPDFDYPVVDMLRLGCWAMDTSQVVGATRLIAIAAGELPDSGGTLSIDCTSAPSASWCQLPRDTGVCCAERCRFLESSCAGSDAGSGGGGEGGALAEAPVEPNRTVDRTESVTSCRGALDGTRCRREIPTGFGQCAIGRCVEQDDTKRYRPPLLVSQCEVPGFASDWLNCFPSPILTYGTCYAEGCRIRCLEDSDCEEAESRAGSRQAGQAGLHCWQPPGSYLGVCVERG